MNDIRLSIFMQNLIMVRHTLTSALLTILMIVALVCVG